MTASPTVAHTAVAALTQFRSVEAMRFSDGWMLKAFGPEIRDGRPVFGFTLEAWRDADDASFDNGDEIAGYVEDGVVSVEQYA